MKWFVTAVAIITILMSLWMATLKQISSSYWSFSIDSKKITPSFHVPDILEGLPVEEFHLDKESEKP